MAPRDMQTTLDFPENPMPYSEMRDRVARYEGALMFSAIGDALGWPTEFLTVEKQRDMQFDLPIKDYVRWSKRVGGLWWGYPDEIEPGQYSDDTQLTLAVARCIGDSGEFEPDRFAYWELPLWLNYERGGGRSVKAAARALIGSKSDWLNNFYKRDELDYRKTGANGAAMRNLPIALANVENETRAITDSVLNTLITHGHPRALIGTVMFGLAIRYIISAKEPRPKATLEYLESRLAAIWQSMEKDSRISEWTVEWERRGNVAEGTLSSLFRKTLDEAHLYLSHITKYIDREPKDYYSIVGALDPRTKGSALGTVCAALYIFSKYNEHPLEALTTSVNILGSDTDTISSFVGALFGSQFGVRAIPSNLDKRLQDHEYIRRTARRLHAIASGMLGDKSCQRTQIKRRDAYMSILAWEIGLHEMFWDAIQEGGVVVHPALGRGKIIQKDVRNMRREGYEAKLLHVLFDSGQSCVFHSRVKNENVMNSLALEVARALR
jgi:ADP-ribosylglycohydrolase